MDSLVFTIIGNDRPGLVERIARIVNEHEANWLGSRMSQLGGKFAGMIQVEGEKAHLDELKIALRSLDEVGLSVTVEEGEDVADQKEARTITVTMLGLDRPGIVREVSQALAAHELNVLDLKTDITQAAMTGRPMFNGAAIVECADNQDLSDLADSLEKISQALSVDIEISDD